MALRKWAYIYLSPGFNASEHTNRVKSPVCEFVSVGLSFEQKSEVVNVAKKLVEDEGVQMIELCGGFGPLWVAEVSKAIHGAVPVGSTAYGPEARKPMLEILS